MPSYSAAAAVAAACASQLTWPAKVSSGTPVSSIDLRLERTRGQPLAIFCAISDPAISSEWVTVSRTMSPTISISKLATEACFSLPGAAQVIDRCPTLLLTGGTLCTTWPWTSTLPSVVLCSQTEPFFQSEMLAWRQYCRVNSGTVIASHTFFGVVLI